MVNRRLNSKKALKSRDDLIDILYLGVASRNYDQSVKYLEKSRKAIQESGAK